MYNSHAKCIESVVVMLKIEMKSLIRTCVRVCDEWFDNFVQFNVAGCQFNWTLLLIRKLLSIICCWWSNAWRIFCTPHSQPEPSNCMCILLEMTNNRISNQLQTDNQTENGWSNYLTSFKWKFTLNICTWVKIIHLLIRANWK